MAKKLFSLSGVVPIAAFVVVHLWTYSKALGGRQAFEAAIASEISPYHLVIEVVGLWLPLAFHGLYGLVLAFRGKGNLGQYPLARNWAASMQRASGVVALGFIVFHFWQFRLPLMLGSMTRTDLFPELCATLSSTARGIPWVAIVYLLGVAATMFHLANGLSSFCFSWGVTRSQRSHRWISGVCGALGLVLFVIGANSVIYFATGSKLAFTARGYDHAHEPITCQDIDATNLQARDSRAPESQLLTAR